MLHPAAGAVPIQAFLDHADWLTQVDGPEEVVDAGREHISILHRLVERDFDEVTAHAPEGEGVRAVELAESGHDVGVNRLGIDATREGGLSFAFPVVIVSGVKPRG